MILIWKMKQEWMGLGMFNLRVNCWGKPKKQTLKEEGS